MSAGLRPAASTALLLLGTVPAWLLGQWAATMLQLFALDLLAGAGAVVLYLNLAGEWLDRLAAPHAQGDTHG